MRFRINTAKAVAGGLTCAAFTVLGVTAITLHHTVFAGICILLALVFLAVTLQNSALLRLDEAGIHRILLGRETGCWKWEDIREYGVMGTRLFGTEKQKNNGTRYLYFSKDAMNDNQRFQLCLNWPPKKCAYALYTDELMHSAMTRLDLEPTYYNATEP